jgi:hypothetical protein
MPAIQFSKTERIPGERSIASSPDPDRRVSRRQPACVEGEVEYHPLPGSVKAPAARGRRPDPKAPIIYIGASSPSSSSAEATSVGSLRGALRLPLCRGLVKRNALKRCSFRRIRPSRGALLTFPCGSVSSASCPAEADQGGAGLPPGIQGDRSSQPRRSLTATAAAARSARPAWRARSKSTTAQSEATALSRSSLTSR